MLWQQASTGYNYLIYGNSSAAIPSIRIDSGGITGSTNCYLSGTTIIMGENLEHGSKAYKSIAIGLP